MFVRCGRVISEDIEIIKQIEYSGVLFGLTNKILYHEGRFTIQGAVLGSTSPLFLDIFAGCWIEWIEFLLSRLKSKPVKKRNQATQIEINRPHAFVIAQKEAHRKKEI